jgi:succinyl-diaminopimelate desuccinylase
VKIVEKDSLAYEIAFLKKLVALDTSSDKKTNYTECALLIEAEAKALGLKTKIVKARAPDRLPRPNVLAELNQGCRETILIVTHFDVVEAGEGWKRNPFRLYAKGNQLFGRGSCDDKGAIAAAFGALRDMAGKKLKRNIKIVAACDEEVGGGYGIKYLTVHNQEELSSDFCLVIDSSFKTIGIGCSGIIRGRITFKGEQGHAGYPFRQKNIVHDMVSFLHDLKAYSEIVEKKKSCAPAPPDAPFKNVWGRFSITMVHSGAKTNMIPGEAFVGCDLRAIPETPIKKEINALRRYIKKLFKKHSIKGRIFLKGTTGYFIGNNNKYAKEVSDVAKKIFGKKIPQAVELGGTDGRFIDRIGIPAIGFGPGGSNPHTTEESISLEELKQTKELVKGLCLKGHE